LKSTKKLKKERIFSLVAIGLLAIVFSISTASAASEVYVNVTGSDTPGAGTMDNPFKTIEYGINQVDNAGTVNILAGTYTGTGNKGITISKNLTISGAGKDSTIIDAQRSGKVFTINPDYTVIIRDLTIQNANNTFPLGGSGETSDDLGGAINNKGTLFVDNAKFTGNYGHKGAAIANQGILEVTSSTFTNNADNEWGGAINNMGVLTVTGSTFTGNYAGTEGGAITTFQDATLTGNTFENNKAWLKGGAIFSVTMLSNSDLVAHNNRFINNQITDADASSFGGKTGNQHNDIYLAFHDEYPGTGTANLTENWWGQSTGPVIGQDIFMYGTKGSYTYSPYLTSDSGGSDTTPPTVTANPSGGTYSGPQNVVLTPSETASIYYTTDGSTPTKSSNLYAGAISITTTKTLKFTAWDSANNQGPVYTLQYNIVAPTATTTKVSTGTGGVNANDNSKNIIVSANGRYVVFESIATNLVSGDTNGVSDIFLYDRVTKTTVRANRGPAGAQANGGSYNPSISADGRYVVYESDATNLVSGDTNTVRDIFLYDTITKTTIRANRGPAGAQAVGGDSNNAEISGNGRYIVYESDATNLVSGDNNVLKDIFLYDTVSKTTIRANRGPGNAQAIGGNSYAPSISADGRYVVYESDATNLVSGDSNGVRDIFLYDKSLNKTIRANRGPGNAQAVGGTSKNASISANGRYIVYESTATNLVSGDNNGVSDIFVYDMAINKTIRANRGAGNAQAVGGDSLNAKISADGRYIVYESDATNLVSGDNNGIKDIFKYDMVLNKTIRANRGLNNAQLTTGDSFNPSISGNGAYIAYASDATDIVSGDTNGKTDVFLYPI